MFPAQALAEAMVRKGWRIKLMTDARGARYAGGFPHVVHIEQVPSATFARGGLVAKGLVPLKVLGGVLSALRALRRDRPAMVIGFGGYPSIPAMSAAWLLRLPCAIHEQNGVLGRVNRIFARRVSVVACGTWPTPLPKGTVAEAVGNPVRAAILAKAGATYVAPGEGAVTSLLVLGGSQGARVLTDVVPEALGGLPAEIRARLHVAHQAREEDVSRAVEAYAAAGIRAEVQRFFSDVPERLSAAQIMIARAGASTMADVTVIGRPAILIPYPHATEDHQTANARALVHAGGAILVPERGLSPEILRQQVALLIGQPEVARQMAEAALSTGRPDATQSLVEIVERLAG